MKNIVALVIVALIFGGGGFYGGMTYQKSQTPSFEAQREQFRAMFGQGAGGQNGRERFFSQGQGRPFAGDIIEKDDTSITIKLQDGSTKIIMLSKNTQIHKSATGSKDDLKKGERVMVIGTENSDGSVAASNVQIGRFGRPQ